jgi:cob(I)alamin adenosyltransferase
MGRIEFEQVTTRGGDRGMSHLADGEPRRKDDPLFEALGDLDELSSWLGVVRASVREGRLRREMARIQEDLLTVGAQVSTPRLSQQYGRLRLLEQEDLLRLESWEKKLLARTEIAPRFILHGDHPVAAWVDVARTVCRRAERRVVALIRDAGMIHLALCQNYINRLSDYLFVLARAVTQGTAG